MRVLTTSALSNPIRCRSGDAPLFMRLLTTSPDCTGFWRVGRGARVGSGTFLGALAAGPVPCLEVGELPRVEHVTPTTPAAVPELPPPDPQRVQEAGEPARALEPVPPRPGPYGGHEVGRGHGLPLPFPDLLQDLQQPRRRPALGIRLAL